MPHTPPADPSRILEDLRYLVEECGERVGGTPAERKALRYVAKRFADAGLENPRLEPFECLRTEFGDFGGEARVGRKKVRLATRPCEYVPSTPPGGVEGELVFMDSGARSDYGGEHLRGRVGLFLGVPMPKPEYLDALQSSGLAAALFVDHRGFSRWPMSLGFPEMWADRIRLPMFSLPYEQAWNLAALRQPVRVKLWCQSRRTKAKSANALADLPGTDPALRDQIIYVSGHVDSVRGSVGANDDGSGTVLATEMARLLAQAPLRRTVRFAGYGVEERLSVGSFHHWQNRKENGMEGAVFGWNADSCGSVLGVNRLTYTGPGRLGAFLRGQCKRAGYSAQVVHDVVPYSDHFAVNMLGRPSVWIYRATHASGNWFFHSEHDNLAATDEGRIAKQVDFSAAALRAMDEKDALPFPASLPKKVWKEVAENVRMFHGLDLEG